MALVHASPGYSRRAPAPDASDADLESVYGPREGDSITIYAHIHAPYVRKVSGMTVVNTGSVSLSCDGDRRAAYLLLDGSEPTIRRVEYDVGLGKSRRFPPARFLMLIGLRRCSLAPAIQQSVHCGRIKASERDIRETFAVPRWFPWAVPQEPSVPRPSAQRRSRSSRPQSGFIPPAQLLTTYRRRCCHTGIVSLV